MRKMGYRAVRTEKWNYIHYVDQQNAGEIYDLRNDPCELRNLINDPRAPKKALHTKRAQLSGPPKTSN